MVDDEQNALNYVAVYMDLTRSKKSESEIQYLTNYDSITNLPNRHSFMMHLERDLKSANLKESKLALIVIGLDNFKIINDTFGHKIGDKLLKAIAARLQRLYENETSVGRLGDDEFAITILDFANEKEVTEHAKQILDIITTQFVIDGHDIMIGACLGVSLFPGNAETAHDLLVNADTALYHAKREDRNSFKFYLNEM